jgi:mannose/fructose/N-acetylgalactosamine-specific phosphotransferase system component IID|tara:strand:- start:411 stop:662 length:252 start_codon:yes stop_codon:yes gene_type:complete
MDESIPVEYDEKFESDFKTKETNQKDMFEKSVPVLIEILVSFAVMYWLYESLPFSWFIALTITGVSIHFWLWTSGKRKRFWSN